MEFDARRVRRPEWLIGGSALLLLIDLFALPWFGATATFTATTASLGQATQVNGWNSLAVLAPLAIVTALCGLAVLYYQGSREEPALPVSLTAITELLALVLTLGLIFSVFIAPPASVVIPDNASQASVGGYLGVLLALGLLASCWWSLRTDGIATFDGPRHIELLRLSDRDR